MAYLMFMNVSYANIANAYMFMLQIIHKLSISYNTVIKITRSDCFQRITIMFQSFRVMNTHNFSEFF